MPGQMRMMPKIAWTATQIAVTVHNIRLNLSLCDIVRCKMNSTWIDIGFKMHMRQWNMNGEQTPILLVHGLSSNAQTWDGVARQLAAWGHPVVAIDQRGHGRSDKLDDGYDFETICGDLNRLIEQLGWKRPLLVGQSWGANVMVAFGALHPAVAKGLVCVDGGYIDLQGRSRWEEIEVSHKPPPLAGRKLSEIDAFIREAHPDWSDEGVAGTLANFEHLVDGTVRPWLTWERHHQILRAIWENRPQTWYPQLQEPVLMAIAFRGENEWKWPQVAVAEAKLSNVRLVWFDDTDHDIHVQKPIELAKLIQGFEQSLPS